MNVPESNFAAWVTKAEHDLLNIQNNLAASHVPWDTVCFHAQQAAEKFLKEFLIHRGRDLSRTHDLVALLAQCAEVDRRLAALESDCHKLTSFGIASRYPDDLFEPTEADARQMVEAAQRVRAAVLSRIPATK
jgi:HEPN domain-containing protein